MTDEELKQALMQYENHPQHSVNEDGTISYDYLIRLIKDYAEWITNQKAFYVGIDDGLIQVEIEAISKRLLNGTPVKEGDFKMVRIIVELMEALQYYFKTRGAFKMGNHSDSPISYIIHNENPNFINQYQKIGSDINNGNNEANALFYALKVRKGAFSLNGCSDAIDAILKTIGEKDDEPAPQTAVNTGFTMASQVMAWLERLGVIDLILNIPTEKEAMNPTRAGKVIGTFTNIDPGTARKAIDAIKKPKTSKHNNNPLAKPETQKLIEQLAKEHKLNLLD